MAPQLRSASKTPARPATPPAPKQKPMPVQKTPSATPAAAARPKKQRKTNHKGGRVGLDIKEEEPREKKRKIPPPPPSTLPAQQPPSQTDTQTQTQTQAPEQVVVENPVDGKVEGGMSALILSSEAQKFEQGGIENHVDGNVETGAQSESQTPLPQSAQSQEQTQLKIPRQEIIENHVDGKVDAEVQLGPQPYFPSPAAPAAVVEEPWIEPPLRPLLPTWKADKRAKSYLFDQSRPLGTKPPVDILRSCGLLPPQEKPRPGSRNGRRKGKQASANEEEAPTGTTTPFAAEEIGLAESSNAAPPLLAATCYGDGDMAETEQTPTESTGPVAEPIKVAGELQTDNIHEALNADLANANANGAPPPTFAVSRRFTKEKLMNIVEAAIAHAEKAEDNKIAGGLRLIKRATITNEFLQAALESALGKPKDAEEREIFESVICDAVTRYETGPNKAAPTDAVVEMTRSNSTAESTVTSSLSSAKTLDAPALDQAIPSVEAAAVQVTPAASRGNGRGRGRGRGGAGRGRPRKTAAPAAPAGGVKKPELKKTERQWDTIARERRKKLQEDPRFTDEAILARRKEWTKEFLDYDVQDSCTRDVMNPEPELQPYEPTEASISIPPSPRTRGEKRSRDALEAGQDVVTNGEPTETSRPASKRARKMAKVNGTMLQSAAGSQQKCGKAARKTDEIDNLDYCRVCNGEGNLLCCDGCVDSFHFDCLDPPMDSKNPPEGRWFCPSCSKKETLDVLNEGADELREEENFALPETLRNYFQGVATNEEAGYEGCYKEVPDSRYKLKRPKVNKKDEDAPFRLVDDNGKVITCVRCGLTSRGTNGVARPIIECDYCDSFWHFDCLDPPPTNIQIFKVDTDREQINFWMCPNHIEHDLKFLAETGKIRKVRRPRHPNYIDIDAIPEDDTQLPVESLEVLGKVYRVPEKSIILDFFRRNKMDNLEQAAIKAYCDGMRERALRSTLPGPIPAAFFGDAAACGASGNYNQDEQDAVSALVGMAAAPSFTTSAPPHPSLNPMSDLVNQLMVYAPDPVWTATSEIDLLRTLQGLVDKRLQALTPDQTTTSSTN